MDKKKLLQLRLEGMTYQAIATEVGVSRQRIQQLLSPPTSIREFVVNKFSGRCNRCGIIVGLSGHVHHKGDLNEESYSDINSLELLCLGCHRKTHKSTPKQSKKVKSIPRGERMLRVNYHLTEKQIIALKKLAKKSGLSVAELIRRAIDAFFLKQQ